MSGKKNRNQGNKETQASPHIALGILEADFKEIYSLDLTAKTRVNQSQNFMKTLLKQGYKIPPNESLIEEKYQEKIDSPSPT